MQSHAIDDIARTSAHGTTRRHVLRAIGAAIISGVAFRLRFNSVLAQASTTCGQDSDCRHDATDPCTGAMCNGGTCIFFIATCIPGYTCCGNGTCCDAATCPSGADCVTDDVVFDPHCGYERWPDPAIPCGDEAARESGTGVTVP